MVDNRNYLVHPHYIAMGLLLIGVSSLFIGFSASYIYSRVQFDLEPLHVPLLFIINTGILISSSVVLGYSMRCYKADETRRYQISLGVTLFLTILFLVSQIIAWQDLYNQGIFVNHGNMASYLYLISFVHFAHVIVGIPFLALFLYTSIKKMKEPVSVLVYFSDPDKKRKLKLLTIYWHFLDILWIYLVVFFLVNSFIK
ncbi:cytochrome c oxidase subunit 3 [Saprospiraceae bacterium]|nr:cytochrome c oxidase subunit 3 [Saprospiraceae bacterium]